MRRLVELHGGSRGGLERAASGGAASSSSASRWDRPTLILERRTVLISESLAEPSDSTPKRVLVVDDNEDGARILARLLTACGHQAELAHDGPTALEAASARPPDVVLLDIGLPGMDGFEVARRLREREGPDRALLVALTGYGREEDLRRSREAGFDHHLVKPVDPQSLIDLLAHSRPLVQQGSA